ncbi:MAG: 1-(5-phosphoribosyl)-5-[(5-phosphoribosylamino)methylideneamino]imidazole-4-carboxamide isomerase [Spirochaetales bacterium]|jgi:phosphoribosylformimino-5-aminoimidazole carboxamide ribotide isomerase|nr:1-(5-phosphoribosyl)-5-[(5-phosphoribosylamino)methylideneamino]imidazole-4-carboxamide isomerase [Spirochaetales bacterium]
MIVIPSIDLLDGKCVRLLQGDYNKVTDYGDDPAKIAGQFQKAGASRIHIVDLDAARGDANNRSIIRKIRETFTGVLEVGGGVRSELDIKELLDIGVDRLILGTVLAKNPDLVETWVRAFGKVLVAGIDARDGEVKVSGWEKDSGLQAADLSRTAAKIGMISIVYTNIKLDGTLSGPDIEGTAAIAETSGLPVILSGGVSSEDDIERTAAFGCDGITGAITGKAVYEGRIDLEKTLGVYGIDNEKRVW